MSKSMIILILCLLASIMGFIAALGYNEETTHKEQLPEWNYNLKLVKSFKEEIKLYMAPNGNCYLRFRDYYQGSISLVKCEDFGVINEKPSTL